MSVDSFIYIHKGLHIQIGHKTLFWIFFSPCTESYEESLVYEG